MIDLCIPLSDIEFEGELETHGTNGVGDLIYLRGQVGSLKIDTAVDSWLIYSEHEDAGGSIPDTVKVRVRLSL